MVGTPTVLQSFRRVENEKKGRVLACWLATFILSVYSLCLYRPTFTHD